MKKKQASEKLYKKLSALRATLSNDERAILDNLMGASEVSAHKMTGKVTGKATAGIRKADADEVTAHKMTGKATTGRIKAAPDKNEVAAHKMSTSKVTSGRIKAAPDKDEVSAHKMTGKATAGIRKAAADEVSAHKMTGKVTTGRIKAAPDKDEVSAHKMSTDSARPPKLSEDGKIK